MRLRVWQCTRLNPAGVGGVEHHISEVSANLRKQGHETHIGPAMPAEWLKPSPELEKQPIVMHTHGDLWPRLAFLRGKLRKRLLWIHVCHGTSVGRVIACREFLSVSGWRGALTDFLPVHLADAAVAVGPHALDEAKRYFRMKGPTRVIANGVDPSLFTPVSQLTLEPRLAFVGRDGDRVKNVPTLLAACASLLSSIPNLKLWCAPGIKYDYRVHPFVKNLGPLESGELAKALAQCRALVLVSLYEGDPIVLREAQALGLPVVASDLAQLRASLAGYPNAVFVSPRNTESVAFGLRTILNGAPPKPSPRVRDWSQVAREFEAFYLELLSTKR